MFRAVLQERGGGGGLELDDVAAMAVAHGADPAGAAKKMVDEAVRRGTTDDVTVVVIPL